MNPNNISVFLDVALSLTFFYFVASMFVSGIVEFINTAFENRSYFLWYALKKLQSSNSTQSWLSYQMAEIKGFFTNFFKQTDSKNEFSGWLAIFQEHPMIKNLECDKGKWRSTAVSYISSDTFVRVVRDMLNKPGEMTAPTDENGKLDSTGEKAKSDPADAKGKLDPTDEKGKLDSTDEKGSLDELKNFIEKIDGEDFKVILKTIANQSSTIKDFEKKLATWYNQYMDHVSGWFKRHTRFWVMGISLIVTICLNLNTIVITKQLSSDKTLRDNIIAMAEKTVNNSVVSTISVDSKNITKQDSIFTAKFLKNDSTFKKFIGANYSNLITNDTIKITNELTKIQYQEAVAKYLESKIQGLGLKMGYAGSGFRENVKLAYKMICDKPANTILGWLLTMAALSFGAPFWFDLLVKLVNVRNVMKKPESK
jgi:hypothetical protein